jgi:penicillin-binding protein 1A
MVKEGYLSEADYKKYSAQPIQLKFHTTDHKEGMAVYLREFLRRYMTAKKPERALYPSWNMVKYYVDSINWESDPLYGWCNKNKKRNGDAYNIYTDGLKVYTTIDSRMQEYAEKAAYQHVVKYLQPAFDKEMASKKNAPYSSNLTAAQVEQILNRSIRQCERYRALKESGATADEIYR